METKPRNLDISLNPKTFLCLGLAGHNLNQFKLKWLLLSLKNRYLLLNQNIFFTILHFLIHVSVYAELGELYETEDLKDDTSTLFIH